MVVAGLEAGPGHRLHSVREGISPWPM